MPKKPKFIVLILFLLFALSGLCQEELNEMSHAEVNPPPEYNAVLELQMMGYREVTAEALLDPRVIHVLQKMFRKNSLHEKTPWEVKQLILKKSKGQFIGPVFKKYPAFLDTAVDILRDREAMPSLVGIFLRHGDLKKYLLIWVGLLIAGALLKKFFFPEEWGSFKRFVASFILGLVITFASFTIFYGMFRQELSPTTDIIVKHWRAS